MSKATARSVTVGLVGLLLLLAWGQAEAQLSAASAEVVRVAGQVSVLQKGQQAWVPAAVGARLVEGDQIRALAGSSADLNLPDGSTILVAENTRFAVTKLEYDPQTRDRNASFHLVAGKVRAQVSSAAVQLARQRQSNFTISTPSGVAAVRGTIETISHRSTPSETIIFVENSPGQSPTAARASYTSRNGQQVTLIGGQFSRQVGLGAPSQATPISSLTAGARASIAGPSNPSTLNDPALTAPNVVIPPASQDNALVASATTGGQEGGGEQAGPPPTQQQGQFGPGRDINANNQVPPCTPSSSTTCP